MVVLLPSLALTHLLILGVLLGLVLLYFRINRFFVMMRRMRWLFLSIMLIYAYTTPGQYVSGLPLELAPTYEGFYDGLLQIGRMGLAVAGVALLMATSTREVLMVGIYAITRPLGLIGVSPERFTARLYLTLQKIETSQFKSQETTASWQHMLNLDVYANDQHISNELIRLDLPKLGMLDCVCIAGMFLLIGIYW